MTTRGDVEKREAFREYAAKRYVADCAQHWFDETYPTDECGYAWMDMILGAEESFMAGYAAALAHMDGAVEKAARDAAHAVVLDIGGAAEARMEQYGECYDPDAIEDAAVAAATGGE